MKFYTVGSTKIPTIGGSFMEVLALTDYQDIYRITGGALLVVNKFKEQAYVKTRLSYCGWSALVERNKKKIKKIHPKCQEQLRIVENGFTDKQTGIFLKKGTVLYNCRPVELIPENEWDYQIRTSDKSFSGTSEEMDKMLSDILFLIRTKHTR